MSFSRIIPRRLTLPLLILTLGLWAVDVVAQRQMEPLGRGVVALRSSTSQAYIGWRLLATDPENIGFNVYRSANGATGVKLNPNPLTNTTDYVDAAANFSVSNSWYVRPVTNGVEWPASGASGLAASAPVRQYIPIPMQPVIGGANPPYDVKFCWVGDFDGDGEYDFLVDRLSTTANVRQYLQAYKRDGTFLWQMDMGPNSTLTSGSSTIVYEPSSSAISIGDKDNVTVYDLDGDGKAEVIVRTSNGVIFGNGATKTGGANNNVQFLSVIDGLTGAEKAGAVVPNPYIADGPLNSHAGILYCDGVHPHVILEGENRVGDGAFQRIATAWTYQNGVLAQRWSHVGGPGENNSVGHQVRQGDVNRDGRDDLIMIGATLSQTNNSATDVAVVYQTELQHGDRYHMTDIDPDRPGLEIYSIQQYNQTLLATTLMDAGNGQFIKKWYAPSAVDVGRGITLDMDPRYRGCEMYSTQPGTFNSKGEEIWPANLWAPEGIWWDADLSREFEDGANNGALTPVINKYNTTSHTNSRIYSIYTEGVHQAYGGRAAFWGDILGDWREELVLVANFTTNESVTNDVPEIRIYSTKIPASNRIYCLMQNPTYRSQCTYKGYYQASYVDYYLGDDMPAPPIPPVSDAKLVWRGGGANVWDTGSTANWFTNNLWVANFTATAFNSGDTVLFDLTGSNHTAITLSGSLTPGDVRVWSPKAYTFDGPGELTGAMALTKAGAGKLTFTGTNSYTGKTLIGEGPFIVNGSLPNSPVTVRGGVWHDGRLGGTGAIGSAVRIEESGGVSPGPGTNAPGTLTISNNLTLAGRTVSDFDLSDNPGGPGNDLLVVSGNLTLQGTNTLIIRKLSPTLPAGVYPLINYSGTLTGSLVNLKVSGLPGVPLALTNPPGQIALVIKSHRAPATINWTGGAGGNVWDLLNTTNWLNGAAKDQFAPGDTVRFDSVGVSNLTANLSGDLNCADIVVDSTADYTLAGSGAIMGSGGLTKSNSGTLTLNAINNTFTGPTVVAGGTLVVPELDAVGFPSPLGNPGSSPASLVLSGNSTLRVTGESYTDRGLTLNAGTNSLEVANAADQVTMAGQIIGTGKLQKLGPGNLTLTANNSFSGGFVIKQGVVSLGGDVANQGGMGTGLVVFDGGTLNMYDEDATYNSASWNFNVPAGSIGSLNADSRVDLYGALTGGGTLNFYVPYVRTTLFGNWSAFTGQLNFTTDGDGGDFRISNGNGYGNASIHLGNNLSAYHTTSGTTVPIGALSGAANSKLSNTAWSVGARNSDTTFAGSIAGNSITKVGTGTWTLTGSNYHTGNTVISGGTLMVNGNNGAATGNVTVNSAGTLAGTGIMGGATAVSGKLAPGNNAIGTLTFNGNLTLNGGGTTLAEINKNAGTKDLVSVAGTLIYGGTLQVSNLAGTLVSGDSYKLFNAATYVGAFAGYNLPALTTNLTWDVSSLTSNGMISVIATNAPPTNAPLPVARYEFEGNAQDTSGNGNHGTAVSVTYAAGQVGAQAAQFNGSSAYVQIPRSIGNTNFSIALWVKTPDSGTIGNGQWWNGKGLVDGEVAGAQPDFGTALVGSQFAFGVGSPDRTLTSSTSINDGQWHHLAVTRESTSGLMNLYVDGNLEGTTNGPTGSKSAPPSLRIGSLQTANNFLNALIDEVRLYDLVLTASDIAQLMAPPPAPPVLTIQLVGGQVEINGTGGVTNGTYYLLSSADVTLPVGSWARLLTNQFDASGNCVISVPPAAPDSLQFYRLQIP